MKKKAQAESEAADIVAAAKDQAKRVAEDARVQMSADIARRQKQAEDSDRARFEAQATSEVRAAAADAAIAAAEKDAARRSERGRSTPASSNRAQEDRPQSSAEGFRVQLFASDVLPAVRASLLRFRLRHSGRDAAANRTPGVHAPTSRPALGSGSPQSVAVLRME